jgi:hypothetical protein
VLREQRQQLTALEKRLAAGETLGPDDAWTHADLTEDHVGAAEALPLFQALVESEKHGAVAKFSVARILINQDEAEGLALLDEVQAQRPDLAGAVLGLQRAYYERQGDRRTARQLTARQYQHADVEEEAATERQGVGPGDILLPHGLEPEALASLLALMQDPTNRVAQAWVLRKKLAHFADEKPFFLIVLRPAKAKELRTDEQRLAWSNALAKRISLPGDGLVLPLIDQFSWLTRQLYPVAGREVYKAPDAK